MFLKTSAFLVIFLSLVACNQAQKMDNTTAAEQPTASYRYDPPTGDKIVPIEKTDEAWQAELSPMAYKVLRQQGTERAFSGDLLNNKKPGIYTCAGCGLPLFSADTKFESGTGWPSFWQPINAKYVAEHTDESYGMSRTEVHCARCGGHQGHVFPDGPKPTGLRYCINSVSLNFVPADKVQQP